MADETAETVCEAFERLTAGESALRQGAANREGNSNYRCSSSWCCRGNGRRPSGTCSSSAEENNRSIAPASRTSPVFRLTKPPELSVATKSAIEGFIAHEFAS